MNPDEGEVEPVVVNVVSNGKITLPAIGFGTVGLKGEVGAHTVLSALRCGYRLLDSAFSYENEGTIGYAVRTSGVPREEIIVTSKLPGRHHEYGAAVRTVEESLHRTGLDYIDLYLVHWPNPMQGRYMEAWKALLSAQERGLVRAIGVSNFQPDHIERLWTETGVLPAVNQVELHPYFPQEELRAYHSAQGILLQAWTPVGHSGGLAREPAIRECADEYGVSPVQVILRWHVQLGVIPIPKAANPDHQRQNLNIFEFELTTEQIAEISALARIDGRCHGQDPDFYEEF